MSNDTVALTHQGYTMLLANREEPIEPLEASLARYKECLRKFFTSCAPDCGAIYFEGLKRALEDCYALYAEERNQEAKA